LLRSTSYHNALRVDGEEMAPILGPWTIRKDATPYNVNVSTGKGSRSAVSITATHGGYRRLPDPVVRTRQITFDPVRGILCCSDHLECAGPHRVERFFHLHPGVCSHSLEATRLVLSMGDRSWVAQWDSSSVARLTKGWICPGYG